MRDENDARAFHWGCLTVFVVLGSFSCPVQGSKVITHHVSRFTSRARPLLLRIALYQLCCRTADGDRAQAYQAGQEQIVEGVGDTHCDGPARASIVAVAAVAQRGYFNS